jgi:hypothetical protein
MSPAHFLSILCFRWFSKSFFKIFIDSHYSCNSQPSPVPHRDPGTKWALIKCLLSLDTKQVFYLELSLYPATDMSQSAGSYWFLFSGGSSKPGCQNSLVCLFVLKSIARNWLPIIRHWVWEGFICEIEKKNSNRISLALLAFQFPVLSRRAKGRVTAGSQGVVYNLC